MSTYPKYPTTDAECISYAETLAETKDERQIPIRLMEGNPFGLRYAVVESDDLADYLEAGAVRLDVPADPDGLNEERARRANEALVAFGIASGCKGDDEASILSDLITDLMHWCDRNDQNFDERVALAFASYSAETAA